MLTQSLNKEVFNTTYQAFYDKVLVGKRLANSRYESELSYGQSVKRTKLDYYNLGIRDNVDGTDLTYDRATDSAESLTINKDKYFGFYISDKEKIQAGPLGPEKAFGKQAGMFMARQLDAEILAEVRNATNTFDNGDLTTRTSSGTPITLSTTNVPQAIAQMRAKVTSDEMNQTTGGMTWVIDPYMGSIVEQYVMGKNIDLAGSTFKNGYMGTVGAAEILVSDNLSADAVLTITAQPTDGQTFIVNGQTFTFVTTIGTAEGNVLIGAAVDDSRLNLERALNLSATGAGTTHVLLTGSAANKWKLKGVTATNDNAADTLTLVGVGSGAFRFGGTAVIASTVSYVNSYYGKSKSIDLVIQRELTNEILRDKDAFGDYVRGNRLSGIKTFDDAKHTFLQVKIVS